MALEIGIPSVNPTRRSKLEGREVAAADHARDLIGPIKAVAHLGCRHARVYLGDRHDRFRADCPWTEQLKASIDVLKRLEPALRDNDVSLAVETHADATADELLALLDEFDPRSSA